jgi:N-formylglutamate amidohydrolase
MSRDELNRRLETIHRPYHLAIADALAAARRQFGTAVLLDCHSMPPRLEGQPGTPIIFGDRYGTTISPELRSVALAAARMLGFTASCNDPYAGGHVIERHGRPGEGIHALQLEIDRSFYLDGALREAGAGFDRAARLIALVSERLAGAVTGGLALPIAAE